MTNITELAQSLKAAAEKATPGQWERGDGKHGGELLVYCDDALGSAVCEATSEYNAIPKYQRIDNLDFIALANPANILALLEALEKAQAVMNAVVTAADIRGIRPFDGIDCDPPTLEENAEACGDAMSARIRELEANSPKPHHNGLMQISNDLASAKQRIAELENYAEAEAVGADRAAEDGVYWMKRCKELESRTVKLPRPGFITISGERMAVYMKGEVVAALLAAGIKVEAE
ncbi:TPA: ead/Ea22-like family protein [Klebsiella pneumoniae]